MSKVCKISFQDLVHGKLCVADYFIRPHFGHVEFNSEHSPYLL